GDVLSVTAVDGDTSGSIAGTYGTLTWNSTGGYTYTLYTEQENAEAYAAVQALDSDDTPLTETFTYTLSDGDATDTADLVVTINGTNDGPVATANTAAVTEDGPVSDSGNLITDDDGNGVDTDLDGDVLSVTAVDGDTSGSIAGTYGTLTWNSTGGYTYTLYTEQENAEAYAAVQALDSDDTPLT
ncbi:VCBS domain-containing protein, partial [Marinobacterium sediminicola]